MKQLFEEKCAERPEGASIGTCGQFTGGVQCAACTKAICYEHSHLCRTCRNQAKHFLYCSADLNTHSHQEMSQIELD